MGNEPLQAILATKGRVFTVISYKTETSSWSALIVYFCISSFFWNECEPNLKRIFPGINATMIVQFFEFVLIFILYVPYFMGVHVQWHLSNVHQVGSFQNPQLRDSWDNTETIPISTMQSLKSYISNDSFLFIARSYSWHFIWLLLFTALALCVTE